MSDILHKTFKVLIGGGEGVSWSAPSPTSPHSLPPSLANTLKHLALVTPREEGELCRRQIEQCSNILNNQDSSQSSVTEAIVRVMFLYLMGHDVSTLYIHAVKLAQAPSLLHRKLGYLASSILLPVNSELRIMITNSLIKDLTADKCSVPVLLVSLVATCNIVTHQSVLAVFLDRVQQLTSHSNYLVRTKALVTLERFCHISPQVWHEVEGSVISCLSDQDPGVVSTAIQIISRKLVRDSGTCRRVVGPVLHVYRQIHQGRLPRDFIYKGLAAPWTQVYILRCLANMNAEINAEAERKVAVMQIFQNIFGLEFSKETIVQVLMSEAVMAVTKLDCLRSCIPQALKIVSKFLQSKNNQVKYCGLDLLKQIFVSSPPALNTSQEDNVIFCLEHPDLPIQIKTLKLLITITNKENCGKIMNSVLSYVKKAINLKKKNQVEAVEEQIEQIYKIIVKFSPSLDWTVESTLRLLQCSRGQVKRRMLENIKLILSQQTKNNSKQICDVEDNFQSIDLGSDSSNEISQVQTKFCQLINKLVQSGVRNPVIIELYVWQLGYFSTEDTKQTCVQSILSATTDLTAPQSADSNTADSTESASSSTDRSPKTDRDTPEKDVTMNENILSQACWSLLDVRTKTGFTDSSCIQFLKRLSRSKKKRLRRDSSRVLQVLAMLSSPCLSSHEENPRSEENLAQTEDLTTSDNNENLGSSDYIEMARETLEVDNFGDLESSCKSEIPDGDHIELMRVEDLDFTLTFLDHLAYSDLCQGGQPYIPLEMRSAGNSLSSRSDDLKRSSERPLITAPYTRIRKDTLNSNRSSVTPPPSPVLPPAPKLWTEEGRVQEDVQDNLEKSAEEEVENIELEPNSPVESGEIENVQEDSLYHGW